MGARSRPYCSVQPASCRRAHDLYCGAHFVPLHSSADAVARTRLSPQSISTGFHRTAVRGAACCCVLLCAAAWHRVAQCGACAHSTATLAPGWDNDGWGDGWGDGDDDDEEEDESTAPAAASRAKAPAKATVKAKAKKGKPTAPCCWLNRCIRLRGCFQCAHLTPSPPAQLCQDDDDDDGWEDW